MRFQTSPLLKPFSKVSVFIGVLGRFGVDGWQKRIKKHAFSNENALVWMAPKSLLPGLPGDFRLNKSVI